MRPTGTGNRLATRPKTTARPKKSRTVPCSGSKVRLAGSAVAALALAAALLATAPAAGAAPLATAAQPAGAAPLATAAQVGRAKSPGTGAARPGAGATRPGTGAARADTGATRPGAGATRADSGAARPGGVSGPLTGDGVQDNITPVAWNGTDLVTAQIVPDNDLLAWEQVPGASSWQQETVATPASIGGADLGYPSIAATASSVQVVSEDTSGNIWFFQQADGTTTWSAPQFVGTVTSDLPDGGTAPAIAWTGVPGHTGTNSVITVEDNGAVRFWYQNGRGWTEETVASGGYYYPVVTATDRGIVIVALGPGSALHSFYQPYGGSGWTSDGTVGVKSGQWFGGLSVTWDGVNVDVVASLNDGASGGLDGMLPDKLVFLWKSDSARSWSDEDISGPSSAQPLAGFTPDIAFTGFNLVIDALQLVRVTSSGATYRIGFWWQGSTFTKFTFEQVATAADPSEFDEVTLASTRDATSSGEVAIVSAFTTNTWATTGLADWTQPTGAKGWTRHTITSP